MRSMVQSHLVRPDISTARWFSWLEHRPVTAGVKGSSPLRVAKILLGVKMTKEDFIEELKKDFKPIIHPRIVRVDAEEGWFIPIEASYIYNDLNEYIKNWLIDLCPYDKKHIEYDFECRKSKIRDTWKMFVKE